VNFKKSLKSVATFVLGTGIALSSMFVAPKIEAFPVEFYQQQCDKYKDNPLVLRTLLFALYITQTPELSALEIEELGRLQAWLNTNVTVPNITPEYRKLFADALREKYQQQSWSNEFITNDNDRFFDNAIAVSELLWKTKTHSTDEKNIANYVIMVIPNLTSLNAISHWINHVNAIIEVCRQTDALRHPRQGDTTTEEAKTEKLAKTLEELQKPQDQQDSSPMYLIETTFNMLKYSAKVGLAADHSLIEQLDQVLTITDCSLFYMCQAVLDKCI